MSGQKRGGLYRITVNGVQIECLGVCTYHLGAPKRTAIIKSDGRAAGFSEEGVVPYIEVDALDRAGLDVSAFTTAEDVTVVVDLANGKSIVLSHAWYAGDGQGESEKGVIKSRWEGSEGNEV
jgi:hypothetical protein